MTFNNFNDIAFNIAESSSNSAQILTQMQLCIKQLEKQHQQQQLKIEKSDQFDKIKYLKKRYENQQSFSNSSIYAISNSNVEHCVLADKLIKNSN